jgi:hypothetical protein
MSVGKNVVRGKSRAAETENEGAAEVIDSRLVDEACRHITDLLQRTFFKGISEVGEYVLRRFFDGDPEQARSRNPLKNASYRALVDRCGTLALPVSRSWLNAAVNLAIQDRILAGQSDAYDRLSPTHKVRLLPLAGEDRKVIQLAERAARREMSTRQLREEVARELAKLPKGPAGRKPQNPIVTTLNRATRTFTLDGGRHSFRKTDVNALTDDEAAAVQESAQKLMERLRDLMQKLKERGR